MLTITIVMGIVYLSVAIFSYIIKQYIDGLIKTSMTQFAQFESNMNANDKLITDSITGEIDKLIVVLNK